jgi:hypothetical protein
MVIANLNDEKKKKKGTRYPEGVAEEEKKALSVHLFPTRSTK